MLKHYKERFHTPLMDISNNLSKIHKHNKNWLTFFVANSTLDLPIDHTKMIKKMSTIFRPFTARTGGSNGVIYGDGVQ